MLYAGWQGFNHWLFELQSALGSFFVTLCRKDDSNQTHCHRLTAALIITLQKISTGHFSITCDTQFATSRMKFNRSFLRTRSNSTSPMMQKLFIQHSCGSKALWEQVILQLSNRLSSGSIVPRWEQGWWAPQIFKFGDFQFRNVWIHWIFLWAWH